MVEAGGEEMAMEMGYEFDVKRMLLLYGYGETRSKSHFLTHDRVREGIGGMDLRIQR